ncbi:hypothetical protein BGC07_10790 [Piscirickettsia litoralis]|uniref:Transposase n=1 Tax=Piscirickettsia litoralis TaxID=1891921 RepID=A0ABX3A476_9GAMM|nr:hypothetical protein BGC07_10790 [Piscirickettsia litoralis]
MLYNIVRAKNDVQSTLQRQYKRRFCAELFKRYKLGRCGCYESKHGSISETQIKEFARKKSNGAIAIALKETTV